MLKDKPRATFSAPFSVDEHVALEVTWQACQPMVAAYRDPDRKTGRHRMHRLITRPSAGAPAVLVEVRQLGRALKQRAPDVPTCFDRPGTSSGPIEAISGHLEHPRGTALGFRNLNNYIIRCLLEAGGFRPRLHPGLRRAGLGHIYAQ